MKKNKKENSKLPGYPHYKNSEDIMNKGERTEADPEDITVNKKNDIKPAGLNRDSKSDLTKEDLISLGRVNEDLDEGEDETLLHSIQIGPDFTGEDLDVPGAELDDAAEDIGSEDEENNYYSRGQD